MTVPREEIRVSATHRADNEFVAAYAIEKGGTGRLQRLNQQSSRGTASCYLGVDATGRTDAVAHAARLGVLHL